MPITCPRCGQDSGRSLGDAGSALPWFSCATCHHVWAGGLAVKATPPEPAAAPDKDDLRKHVFVADDDTLMLSIVERALFDYRVSTARDGHEALAALASDERVDLLITDYLMPGMTGNELVKRARVMRPDLVVLVITGHGQILADAESAWWEGEPHLNKPFLIAELRSSVERLIGGPLPKAESSQT